MQNQKLYRKSYDTNYLDFVFVNDMGTLFKPDYITRHFKELLQRNNPKVIRVHDNSRKGLFTLPREARFSADLLANCWQLKSQKMFCIFQIIERFETFFDHVVKALFYS